MKIYREKAGVISEEPIWVFFDGTYMYEKTSLAALIWCIIKEWRQDKHLIG